MEKLIHDKLPADINQQAAVLSWIKENLKF
jgi:hypothetical protein